MGRKSKKDRPPAIVQGILADNLRQLRDYHYKRLPHATAMNRALAKDIGTSLSQIQRILRCQLSPGVDMLENLARALHVTPPQLITPYFAQSHLRHSPEPGPVKPTTGRPPSLRQTS